MARTLAGCLSDMPHIVHYARDLELHQKTDIEWIEYLARTGDDWDGLIQFTSQMQAPYLIELSINLTSKFKPLPL